jgi:hypothetical protein
MDLCGPRGRPHRDVLGARRCAKVAETGRDPSAVTSVIRHTVRAGSESGWGQTRSFGDVGSMSGLREGGRGELWAASRAAPPSSVMNSRRRPSQVARDRRRLRTRSGSPTWAFRRKRGGIAAGQHIWRRNILFLLCFSRNAKVGNPTHGLRICKTAEKRGRRKCGRPCRYHACCGDRS